MLKFDFKTYAKNFYLTEEYNYLYAKKDSYIKMLKENSMTGWMRPIEREVVEDIKETANQIKKDFDCLVVIGIGGSFLGSYAFHSLFKQYFNDHSFEVIYAGTTLSSKYLDELLSYLRNKNFCINVISKSGTTMETTITYKVLKDLLKRKYSKEEIQRRIIITTDKEKGTLHDEAKEEGYKTFEIPNDIGGRYSFMTPAHLLPLALNYDLEEIVDGYYDGKRLVDVAFEYAVTRRLLFSRRKYVENYCVYEENMLPFTEWLKQLFGETEGKNGVGIYPTSSLHTRDLHSLGQFVQEGNKILFETFIKVANSDNYIDYKGKDLQEINNIVLDSVERAHFKGGVPCLEIEMSECNVENITALIYFFMLSAAFSGFLFGANPFDQPGVEVYKQEVRESLGK